MRWTETFLCFLHRSVGERITPLVCIVRAVDLVDCSMPFVLTEDVCRTECSRSLEEELSRRSLHDHSLFKKDNAAVHHFLEEATRSTVCSDRMKTFQKKKDGRNAWFSMVKQYDDDDQWKHQLEKSEDHINTKFWKGNTSQPFSDNISKHRNAHVSMIQCSNHVSCPL